MGPAHRRGGDRTELATGMCVADRGVHEIIPAPSMLGSRPTEYVSEPALDAQRFYTVDLFGRKLWGWERRDASGALIACSEQLFMDYVSCFCDAQRRNA